MAWLTPQPILQVMVVPQALDDTVLGQPQWAGSFSTAPPERGPQPSPSLQISPVVGSDRFSVEGLGQDKPGFVYVLVTRPGTQGTKVGS